MEERLLELAPLDLPNTRNARFLGDNLAIQMDGLAPQDQESLRLLYRQLSELLSLLIDASTDDQRKWEDVSRWVERYDLSVLIDEIRGLGRKSYENNRSEELAKAMHDLRGGALSALLGRLQLLDRLPQEERNLKMIFVLTRDQLKIMRNALQGLDEPRREADKRPRSHDINLMLDKWQESVVGPQSRDRPIRMFMDCRYEGALTECCLESAAVDRIFYNLANNATRHCAGDRLDMLVFPVSGSPGGSLRFVLSNPVSPEDAEYLRTQGGPEAGEDPNSAPNLAGLFTPEVSSSGSGFGLTVVADFVADAFGLPDRTRALRERYVGAVLDGETFRVWFHWPVADSSLPPKLDDYHQPEHSISEP